MDEQHLEAMYRMVEENNSILRGMRRTAFLKGLLKFALLAAIVFGIYMAWQSYIQPTADKAAQTYQSAQAQLESTQKSLKGVQEAASSTQSFFGGILKNLGF